MTMQWNRRAFFKNGGVLLGAGTLATTALGGVGCDLTPAQMAGPFYPENGQSWEDADLTGRDGATDHEREGVFRLVGQVRMDNGRECLPVRGARVEIWQADPHGRYKHSADEIDNPGPRDPSFQYWGEATTDSNGIYGFVTLRPGKYPGRTPHIHYRIVSPDRQVSLITQLYFTEHQAENARDGIYADLVRKGLADLVTTTIQPAAEGSVDLPVAGFDIVLNRTSHRNVGSTPAID